MRNETKREALKVLANAPTIAAKTFLNSLKDQDERREALKLFEALGVIKKEVKNVRQNYN